MKHQDVYTNGSYIRGPRRFLTRRGLVLDAPKGGFIGQRIYWSRALNQTLHRELMTSSAGDNFSKIVRNLVSDIDYVQKII